MKQKIMKLKNFILLPALMLSFQTPVFAESGSDVFTDILKGPRYQGTVNALKGVTATMDTIFMGFISICAFFIISCALLKNVVAGVYASYPIFFDKVHDAKLSAAEKFNDKYRGLGSVASFLLGFLPDFKEMSEFRDDNIQPRDYFLKAIPQMFCTVMIGVVIYNGYYRDIIVKAAQFGSTMIERFLDQVDPVQVFDNITNGFGMPKSSYDAGKDSKSKLIASITKKMYSKTVSFYTDITTAEAKTALVSNQENWVAANINTLTQYTDDKKYKSSFQIDRVLGDIDVASVNRTEDGEIIRAWVVPFSQFNIQSGEHLDEDWRLRVIVKFTKKYSGVSSSGTISNAQLVLPASYKTTPTGDTTKDLIKMSTAEMKGLVAGNSFKVDGKPAELTSKGIVVEGHISGDTVDVSDLYYSDSKSPSNMVKSISLSGSAGSVSYTDQDGNVPNWAPGETAYSKDEKEVKGDGAKKKNDSSDTDASDNSNNNQQ